MVLASFVLSLQISGAQVLLSSWENSPDDWTVVGSMWTAAGYSTTTGVTNGSYSLILGAGANPDYGAAFVSGSSVGLTTILATAQSISFDATVPVPGDFGSYLQFSLIINNPDTGYTSLDGYTYAQAAVIGSDVPQVLTWAIPQTIRDTLSASTNPTSLVLQVGGGGAGTLYIDNLTALAPVPEPGVGALLALAGVGVLPLLGRRRG